MGDGIHDFTVTDHQKNLLEELIIIVLWIACAVSEFSERMMVSTFLKCIQNMIFNDVLCFLLPFFFLECSLKVEVDIIHGRALYTGIYVKV